MGSGGAAKGSEGYGPSGGGDGEWLSFDVEMERTTALALQIYTNSHHHTEGLVNAGLPAEGAVEVRVVEHAAVPGERWREVGYDCDCEVVVVVVAAAAAAAATAAAAQWSRVGASFKTWHAH